MRLVASTAAPKSKGLSHINSQVILSQVLHGNVLDHDTAVLAKQSSSAKRYAYVNPLHYLDNRTTVATPLLHGTERLRLLLCGGNGYCTLRLLYGTGVVVATVAWLYGVSILYSLRVKQLRPSIFSPAWTSTFHCPSSKE